MSAKSKSKCEGVICSSDKICNPTTGRCVKKTGKIGKKILNKLNTRKSKSKCEGVICSSDKICNPTTGRCVKKTGKIGKKILKKVRPTYNTTNTSRWADTKKDNRSCVKRSKLPLRNHQKKVVRYMKYHRGLLVVHGTGTGKTLTAITVSQCYLDENPGHKVVFVGPSALESNFKKELRNYGVNKKDIDRSYKFYSFQRLLGNTKRRIMNKVTKNSDRQNIGWPLNPISMKNSLLIVDESHNVRNPNTSTSRSLVESSFTADKVLLLTATPFVNSMKDYIPLINMIYGKYIVGSKREFKEGLVCDYISSNKSISKEDINTFSYLLHNKVDVVNKKDEKYFPKRKDKMVYVKMSPSYLETYTKLIHGEKIAGLFFKSPEKFYNGYRRAVNMAGPEYFSKKVMKAIPILKKGKALVYSNWLKFGVNPISQALKKSGISFRIFTGKTSKRVRQSVIDDFNSNKFQVLIVSSAGGEGLDLKGVKSVVVLDPPWNAASLEQVIGRAIRYKSHTHLPKKDRFVNVYLMTLVDPKVNISKIKRAEVKDLPTALIVSSGDLLLYDIIRKKGKLSSELSKVLQKLSISR